MVDDNRTEEEFADDKSVLGTAVKKLFTAGMGAAFLTEEGIRSYVSDLKLPKDVLKMLLQGAQKSKEDLTAKVGHEIVEMLEKVDWAEVATGFIAKNKFKISLELDVVPKEPIESSQDEQE